DHSADSGRQARIRPGVSATADRDAVPGFGHPITAAGPAALSMIDDTTQTNHSVIEHFFDPPQGRIRVTS
ncbi:MAG: hypothetical protein P4M00_23410, partial [Azospirillaceae bacterium]|nr:hypothetical protein [Azospirillaceae bacterium]